MPSAKCPCFHANGSDSARSNVATEMAINITINATDKVCVSRTSVHNVYVATHSPMAQVSINFNISATSIMGGDRSIHLVISNHYVCNAVSPQRNCNFVSQRRQCSCVVFHIQFQSKLMCGTLIASLRVLSELRKLFLFERRKQKTVKCNSIQFRIQKEMQKLISRMGNILK